ncbi:MAG: hypothetical protein B0D92_06080 [Spirochaeta sp. LUC14_002_19_P3]|nr:MAG: hypothetical protein B0D92_06080 [Spirochaeta sp. LUC14_002_19_P3]
MCRGIRIKFVKLTWIIIIFSTVFINKVYPGDSLNSDAYKLYRALQLVGLAEGYTGNIYSRSTVEWRVREDSHWHNFSSRRNRVIFEKKHFKFLLTDNQFNYSFNSTLPYGFYDGAQWQGKGSNLFLNLGLGMEWKGLSINLEGGLWFAENSSFPAVPVNYSHYAIDNDYNIQPHQYWYFRGGSIDYYQHPTDANTVKLDLGQSGIRYSGRFWTIGFSTENIWLGPTRYFPILFSNQAGGFPHFDFGTLGFVPLRIKKTDLGLLDIRAIIGLTKESDYFDDDPSNDYTQNLHLSLGYAFPFLKNLKFGVHYLVKRNMPNYTSNILELFNPSYFFFSPDSREATDGMLSFTVSWSFPSVGLEIYSEYARNDFSAAISEVQLTRIDHADGYTLGLEKVFRLKNERLLSLVLEFSDLQQIPYSNRSDQPIWYKHFTVMQGHTYLGQLMGNPIGPGSDSQIMAISLYDIKFAWRWWLQRIFVDKDFFMDLTLNDLISNVYNYTILTAGIRYTRFWRYFDWSVEAVYSLHLNYGFLQQNHKHNLYLGLEFRY